MDEMIKLAEWTKNYVSALKKGLDRFASMLPVMVEQHIQGQANQKLDTTRDEYMSAVKVKMTDYLLVVELDEDNWVANAVESGADPFDMKSTHLKSPKARLGKEDKFGMRYRYLRIPMSKKEGGAGGGTDKSQAFQAKINAVMAKPGFGTSRLSSQVNGTVTESQKVINSDPDLQGLYRVRSFGSVDEALFSQKKPQWQMILFRTMSENPMAKGRWEHPGIRPMNIFNETDRWLKTYADDMLDVFIKNETDKVGDL